MLFAIDPGSEKTGTAILREDGSLVSRQIVPTGTLAEHLTRQYAHHPFSHIVMGDGTNHRHLQPVAEAWIRTHHPEITFSLIDEKFTTVEGRIGSIRHVTAGVVWFHFHCSILLNRWMISWPGLLGCGIYIHKEGLHDFTPITRVRPGRRGFYL